MMASESPRINRVHAYIILLSFAGLILTNLIATGGENIYVKYVGLACFFLAGAFAIPPFIMLKKFGQVREGEPYYQTTKVVDRGVYAIVRHPQYLGYMLLGLGFSLTTQHWLGYLFGGVMIVILYVASVAEEKYCVDHLGGAYKAYMQRVPRFNFVLGLGRYLLRPKNPKVE